VGARRWSENLVSSAPEPAIAGFPLLATKLYIPQWRPGLVSRPRLVERLCQGAERTLTLVTAPAGFGKSTLLAEWLATIDAGERVTAWVSLDVGDNDPAIFWAYVIAALQTIRAGIGATALALLSSPQPPPIEPILISMINELAAAQQTVTLVLDDLHVIDAQPINAGLAFLVDHLPPNVHLVIASRADPSLPLARMRARGELTELRAADLRFTADEAAAFLNDVMGLAIPASDVAALETRTEGWIAGLQLAALSMQGRSDVSGFIAAFAGDDRYIVDYLAEEVLQRQPAAVRDFLLATSILDRLSGGLCDAVTGLPDGRTMLEQLERGNLFVVPLDDRRHWYRYHHLFADVLRAHLQDERAGDLPALHRRASEWYEQNGFTAEAIRHALAAQDLERAANLIELASAALRRNRQEVTLLGWLRMLPDEVVRIRPVLSVVYAGILLTSGETEGVEARFLDAERCLDTRPAGMVVVDDEEFRRLPASIAVHRAGLALALGDLPTAVTLARRALDVALEDDHLYRGAAAAILGLAAWSSGDLEGAYQSYSAGMESLRKAGNITDTIGGAIALADIRITQGRLREAMRIYRDTVQRAIDHGAPAMRGTADMHVGMSTIAREWNDLAAASQHLARCAELGEAAAFPQNPYRWRVAMARIREAEGDLDGALELLDEAERRYVSDFYPYVRPIAALKARVWIAQGRLNDALGWAREQGLSATDELSYLREFEHLTLARALVARHAHDRSGDSMQDALSLLDRIVDATGDGKRTGSLIEALVLLALTHAAQGDLTSALVPLERALNLAEPEGYVRIFADEGEPMRNLLRQAATRGITLGYTRRLLSAFDAPAGVPSTVDQAALLAEPLTAREIDVLRLIAAGLRNEEIAGQLFISLATVKRHIANAYGKLAVSNRVEAVSRARELGLL
jgi:LuxR family maltose regulon positive regulatory protein